MELTPSWVTAGVSVAVALGGGVAAWLRGIDNAQESRIYAVKETQKLLFSKLDIVSHTLQEYKLHVAETYVNREILKEQLLPIHKTLENIQQELHDTRRRE